MDQGFSLASVATSSARTLDVDTVRQAWLDAGRPGLFSAFSRSFLAKHEAMAAEAPRIELWIRRKGTRRQAYWRVFGSGATFEWVEITKADRAEREGRITVGPLVDAAVVMYEEPVTQ
ncbi:hypothetical protein [Variovorax paradoxus]|uniref:hypothetical protein n=1 Tax=Variovorax paradoxus TaxID=34073 RepID=UPI001932820B|nr:hypothetical protein INQ48_20640 [Variovorax paradoxus]